MKIILEQAGKRYGSEWIFKNVNYTFESDNKYALIGPNGSGKSTLMKLISGGLLKTKGNVIFEKEGKKIPDENIWPLVSFAAPYTELIENLTLTELIDFHFHFKKTIIGIEKRDIINLLDLDMHKDKFIKTFSSGMKQRVKLGFAIFTDTPILLLDEPTSNFDKNACNWYHQLIEKYIGNRLLIIGSNNEEEYHFCNHKLCISDYKLG
ncbi:MAG: ATP-binding cassette domain-containing protein [Bacteroidetes bacterium]|nr:ATP-binding cassette domain-containing protein [Bacteroidota bacterium]